MADSADPMRHPDGPQASKGSSLARARQDTPRTRDHLSRDLLLIAVLAVLVVESVVFGFSMASFRAGLLGELVARGRLVAHAANAAAPAFKTAPEWTSRLLEEAQLLRVVGTLNAQSAPVDLVGKALPADQTMPAPLIWPAQGIASDVRGALATLFRRDVPLIVLQVSEIPGERLEMVANRHALAQAMERRAGELLMYSAVLALFVTLLLFAAVQVTIAAPLRQLAARILRFASAPMDVAPIPDSLRTDQIGDAQRALRQMELRIRSLLNRQARLAALGGAVARLMHDLRGALGPAQLAAERLSEHADPAIQLAATRLDRSIERATTLANQALAFSQGTDVEPEIKSLNLAEIANEALREAIAGAPHLQARADIPDDLAVQADIDWLHRILSNLLRNAMQAIAARQEGPNALDSAVPLIRLSAQPVADGVRLLVADSGGGLSRKAMSNLFSAFAPGRPGGTGLGLTIARELARGMGGDVVLVSSDANGTVFAVDLPQAARPSEE